MPVRQHVKKASPRSNGRVLPFGVAGVAGYSYCYLYTLLQAFLVCEVFYERCYTCYPTYRMPHKQAKRCPANLLPNLLPTCYPSRVSCYPARAVGRDNG